MNFDGKILAVIVHLFLPILYALKLVHSILSIQNFYVFNI